MKIVYLIMLLLCSSTEPMNAPKTIDEMNLEELENELNTKRRGLNNPILKNTNDLHKTIEAIQKLIEEKKGKASLQKETLSEKKEPIEQKNVLPVSREKTVKSQSILIDQVTDVKKIIALPNGTIITLCKENNSNKLVLKKLNENNWIDFNIPKTETKIFKDTQPIINDIAVYNNTVAIATFYKKERSNLLGMSEDTEAVIYVYDLNNNESSVSRIQDAHKTAIKALFMDENFVVSQSEAGNVRFFALNTIKSPTRVSGDVAPGTTVVDPDAEYKAKSLVAYTNNCFIAEEKTMLFGNELYVKYIDEMADIIVQNKIGAYKKEDSSPYIGSINSAGDAIIYDQRSRSLIHTKKIATTIQETIIKRADLPEELAFKVAKQIYYIDDKILLVYEDEIASITIDLKTKKSQSIDSVFTLAKKSDIRSIIHTTCLHNNMLYVVIKQKSNNSKEILFTMEHCPLNNIKE